MEAPTTSYLTPQEAHTRLLNYDIDVLPSPGFIAAATRALDSLGPFIGNVWDEEQVLEFPRDQTLIADTEGEVPEAILDWVALQAVSLSENEAPPITSISLAEAGSVTYASPNYPRVARLQSNLLNNYTESLPGSFRSIPIERT